MPNPHMPQYAEYYGTFICQECGLACNKARFWHNELKEITWRCSDGHVSTVSLRKPTKQEIKAKYAGG